MRVRRLEIEKFRGIRALDWRHIGDTAALVGPGDSGKSTILDALERVLSPRWNFPFDDSDFFALDPACPLRIRATVVDFPPSFLRDSKFGLAVQAFDDRKCQAKPPTGESSEVLCLVIELAVDGSLEPQWNVVDAKGELHTLLARDREALGMLRVGTNIDMHLGWNRGSALNRVTEAGDAIVAIIADATRQARAGLAVDSLDRLKQAAVMVETLAKKMGATVQSGFVPHLDVSALAFSGGSLSLHDGNIPLRRAGLGSRRLITAAMQHHASGTNGLTLIDEFEHGLEPHRIRQLLRKLRGVLPEDTTNRTGQLVLTSHSPTVIAELEIEDIHVLNRAQDGSVAILRVKDALRKVVMRTPGALVARNVIVAEGPTEVGLLRSVEATWSETGINFAYLGTAIVDGQGQNAPDTAGALCELGFTVALFMDRDQPGAKLSRAKCAKQLLWPQGMATENVLAADLSDEAFAEMVKLAQRGKNVTSARSIRDALAHRAELKPNEVGSELKEWQVNVPNFRQVFGATAKSKEWFKSLEMGRELGRIVAADWNNIETTSLRTVLEKIRAFAEHG